MNPEPVTDWAQLPLSRTTVDRAAELRDEWFDGVTTVGVTSGASVPEILVRDVLDSLSARGFDTVEEVRTATEDLMFSLPREIRADLKAKEAERALRA